MNVDNNMIFGTLFDSNYLDKGLALYHSMRRHIEEFMLYIFALDDKCYEILSDMRLEGVILIPLKDIMDIKLQEIREERTRAEFCWTCTPIIIEHVLVRYQERVCTYIDADIYFFANPESVIKEIRDHGCSVGVTPHRFERNYINIEQMFNNGKYCIQFNTFFHNEEGLSVLRDWKEDCLNWCYSRYEDGKYGDQKYADTWKMKHSCVCEIENVGAGVAPWNLHLYVYDGRKDGRMQMSYRGKDFPLIFYHFEGMKYLNDGRIFLHLWEYRSLGMHKKVKEIYGEYFKKLSMIRRHLKKNYGISFRHMEIEKKDFLANYSLKSFCKDNGLLGGWKKWFCFQVNNLQKGI